MASPTGSSFDETVELTQVIRSCTKIATHLRPDLDALLSLWLCQRHREVVGLKPAQLLFIKAGTESIEEGVLAVDVGVGAGLKRMGAGWSIKRSERGGSAAMAVYRTLTPDDRYLFQTVVEAISDADEGENVHKRWLKKTKAWKNRPVRNQVLTTSLWVAFGCASEILDDHALYKWFSCYLQGMVKSRDEKLLAEEAARQAQYMPSGLAILPHNAPSKASNVAFKRGARLAFFSQEAGGDRWILGITKSTHLDMPDEVMQELKHTISEVMPDAFIHEDLRTVGWVGKSPLVCSKREFEQRRTALLNAVIGVLERKMN